MGRSRRRNRREFFHASDMGSVPAMPGAGGALLTPDYVTVDAGDWDAESDAPVLPLEGIKPWEAIRGPAIALLDDAAPADDIIPDSRDPSQLALDGGLSAAGEAPVAPERPDLVLESEPPVEVQAELPLQPGATTEAAPAAAAEVLEHEAEAAPVVATEPEPLPDPVELRYQEARSASDEGRSADAQALYRQVVAERPGHLGARNNLALLLERDGKQQAALTEYDKALDVDGEHATLLTNRGALLGAMGRYAAAERDLKKVLRTEPAHPEALFNLGVVMTRKGLWAEAVPQLRRVVELEPSRGAAFFYLGEALNHIDDLYGAMAAYQRAAELMPDHPRALYGLGIVYDRLGRPDDAARMYRKSREVGRR